MALGHYMCEKSAKSKGTSPAGSTRVKGKRNDAAQCEAKCLRTKPEIIHNASVRNKGSASLVKSLRRRFNLALDAPSGNHDSSNPGQCHFSCMKNCRSATQRINWFVTDIWQLVIRHTDTLICLQWYVLGLAIRLSVIRYLGKTRSNLGKKFLHPQKYGLPYTIGVYHNDLLLMRAIYRWPLYLPVTPCPRRHTYFDHPWKNTFGYPWKYPLLPDPAKNPTDVHVTKPDERGEQAGRLNSESSKGSENPAI